MDANICVIDTETTGLDLIRDEILEIAIIDNNGEELLRTLVRPMNKTSWPEAQRIHHITPQDVANAPTLDELREQIREIVAGQLIVIYNAEYDQAMLGSCIDTAADVKCCMVGFAQEYSDLFDQQERWHKLVHAAHFVGHDWGQDAAHRAIHDASATLSVWQWLNRRDPGLYPVALSRSKEPA